jgi:hypothetical protein
MLGDTYGVDAMIYPDQEDNVNKDNGLLMIPLPGITALLHLEPSMFATLTMELCVTRLQQMGRIEILNPPRKRSPHLLTMLGVLYMVCVSPQWYNRIRSQSPQYYLTKNKVLKP